MKESRDGMKNSQLTDDVIDDVEDLATDNEPSAEASTPEDRVSELERELTIDRDKYLRLVAEFDNFRKRMMKERLEAEARGQADLVKHMLDPLDDIARFAHLDPATTESALVVEGVALVEKKLEKALRAAGLEVVNPIGAKFDPALHEAVAIEATNKKELDGTVAQVYQVGYAFKGQMLRPARVVVRQHQSSH